jgi:hypothetical protein
MKTKLITTGDIVKETGEPFHIIEYLLKSRKIEPVQRAGRFRLYRPEVIQQIRVEREQMTQRGEVMQVD